MLKNQWCLPNTINTSTLYSTLFLKHLQHLHTLTQIHKQNGSLPQDLLHWFPFLLPPQKCSSLFTHLPHWLIHHSCLSTHPGAFTCTRMLDVWCWIGQTVVSHPASGCITGKSWQGKLSDCGVVKGVVFVLYTEIQILVLHMI